MRARVDAAEVTLENHRAELLVAVDLSGLDGAIFGVDIYTWGHQVHPELHLGWWQVTGLGSQTRVRISIDLSRLDSSSVQIRSEDGPTVEAGHWVNPDYEMAPVQDLQLVVRDRDGTIVELQHLPLRITDPAVLAAYASRVHKTGGYKPADDHLTLMLAFHHYKLQQLASLFDRHVPIGGRALDVGCGRSLFTEILEYRYRRHWPFELVCADVAADLMEERRAAFPQYRWMTSDALAVSLGDETFDLVFAGEIIEHITDGVAALAEWYRLLRPGGVLVLTTPNRKRLLNLVNRSDEPMGPDHVNEMTYPECRDLLQQAGFTVEEARGIYLQLLLSWHRPGPRYDLLEHRLNRPRYRPLMRLMLILARWLPHFAYDVVYVARKPGPAPQHVR